MMQVEDATAEVLEEDDDPLPQRAALAQQATENTWIIEWGVRDSYDRITECASAHDAREYQAMHGGTLVSREIIRTYW
jgi:hypothetical protein